MDRCDAKQKAFAQRVYLDLKICRQWPKLHVYFHEVDKRVFFVGTPSGEQPLTFVLPMSCDAQLTVDDLFTLKAKLASALPCDTSEAIQSVLMAIVANDFTVGYFNFTNGLPAFTPPELRPSEPAVEQPVATIEKDIPVYSQADVAVDEWTAVNGTATWD